MDNNNDEGGEGGGRGRGRGDGKRENSFWKLLTKPKLRALDENNAVEVFDPPPPTPPPPPPPPPERSPKLGDSIPQGLLDYGNYLVRENLAGLAAYHDLLVEIENGEDGTESMGVGLDIRGIPKWVFTFSQNQTGRCTPATVKAVLKRILELFYYPITKYSFIPESLAMTLIYVTIGRNFSSQQVAEMRAAIRAMNGLSIVGVVDDRTTHVVDICGASSVVLEGRRRGHYVRIVLEDWIWHLRNADNPYIHGTHTQWSYAMPLAYNCNFVIAASVGGFAEYVRNSLSALGGFEIPSNRMSEAHIAVCMSSADPEFMLALKYYVKITVSPGWAVLCSLDMVFYPPEQYRVRDPSNEAQLKLKDELDRIRRTIDPKFENSQSPFGHIGDTRRSGSGRTSRARFSSPPGLSRSLRSNPGELDAQLRRLSLATPTPKQPPRPPEPVLGGRPRSRPSPRSSRDLHSFAPHPAFSQARENYDPYRQQQPEPGRFPPFDDPLPPQTSRQYDRFMDNSVAHVASYLGDMAAQANSNNARDNNYSQRLSNMTRTTSLLGNYPAQFTRPTNQQQGQQGQQRQGQPKKFDSNIAFNSPPAANTNTRRRANSHPNSPKKKLNDNERNRRSSGPENFKNDNNGNEIKLQSPSPIFDDDSEFEPRPPSPKSDEDNEPQPRPPSTKFNDDNQNRKTS